MNNVAIVVGVVGGLIGLAGGAGGLVAYYRAGLQRATVELYATDNDALRGRVDTLENERDVYKNEVADLRGKVAALQEERKILRDLATGHSAVDALGEIILHHHAEQMDTLRSIRDKMN